eukprot:TRINITY_DN13165_c0_g1_i1.p1 TRINITY_DN13165_c0_g1~~TRINITY_DN13165_c0_g1_i1.p1  ORF type:complete len:313 (+),score=64.98 TRINITY_DN13165_c0_g1_i1:192-1130(+)
MTESEFRIYIESHISTANSDTSSVPWVVDKYLVGDFQIIIRDSDNPSTVSTSYEITILDYCEIRDCGENGVCVADTGGACDCDEDWGGDDCENSPCDESNCVHGTCNGELCECDDGYSEPYCEPNACTQTCGIYGSQQGACDDPCTCFDSWSGDICDECGLQCGDNGSYDELCQNCGCVEGYWSLQCENFYVKVSFVLDVQWDDVQINGEPDIIFEQQLIIILASELNISPARIILDAIEEWNSVKVTFRILDVGIWEGTTTAEEAAQTLQELIEDPNSTFYDDGQITSLTEPDSFELLVILTQSPTPREEV